MYVRGFPLLCCLVGIALGQMPASSAAADRARGGFEGDGPPARLTPQWRGAGDDRAEATRLLRAFVTRAPFECLLILRASARNAGEVLLFVCDEDDIRVPDLRGLVSSFRIGLTPAEPVSIDVVHNHPESLLSRTHSSSAASYSERRRLLGLHSLADSVVASQIRLMRSGELPCAVLPPSTEDLVTALKIFWLCEGQRVNLVFRIPDIGGLWSLERNPEGWRTRKYVIKRLLASDRLYRILRGLAPPRNQLEERYSALAGEYYVLRNRIAQVFSQEAFDRFEDGDSRGVEQERLRTERRLGRLREVALRLGIVLEFEANAECRPGTPREPITPPLRVVERD